LEKKREKERKRKAFYIIQLIKLILFNLVQNLTSPERLPKITENREYYLETYYENGLKKISLVCKLKILKGFAGTRRHRFGRIFDKFRKIPKNSIT